MSEQKNTRKIKFTDGKYYAVPVGSYISTTGNETFSVGADSLYLLDHPDSYIPAIDYYEYDEVIAETVYTIQYLTNNLEEIKPEPKIGQVMRHPVTGYGLYMGNDQVLGIMIKNSTAYHWFYGMPGWQTVEAEED